jgi:hypothetical protein
MPFVAVLCLVLLFIAALGSTWWWRTAEPLWYGHAAFHWGIFFLALYLTWPVLKALGV